MHDHDDGHSFKGGTMEDVRFNEPSANKTSPARVAHDASYSFRLLLILAVIAVCYLVAAALFILLA